MFAKVKERIEAGGGRPGTMGTGSGGSQGTTEKAMPSIVSRDMTVTGNLDTPGEVHVEGAIKGDVSCAKLIIGASGSVEGHIYASAVRIHGTVRGQIDAEEVFLLNGSSVSGDVIQNMLEIAPGASFEGAVRRRGSTAVKPAAMLAAPIAAPPATDPAIALAAAESGPAPEAKDASSANDPVDLKDAAEPEPLVLEAVADAPAEAEEGEKSAKLASGR